MLLFNSKGDLDGFKSWDIDEMLCFSVHVSNAIILCAVTNGVEFPVNLSIPPQGPDWQADVSRALGAMSI